LPCGLRRNPGNNVEDRGVRLSMRSFLRSALVAVVFLSSLPAFAQEAYFPKNALSDDPWDDQFKSAWYSGELKRLQEPSLLSLSKDQTRESYRFFWVRSFHNPIAIRLDERADGTGVLTTKVANGEAGFPRTITHLIEDTSRPISREQTRAFLSQLERTGFWSLQGSVRDQTGTDGAQWIIEGIKNGTYHVVDRWSPKAGVVRDLGLTFIFGMAQMNVPKDQTY